jgi:uncharacterized membrane protein YvbJ
MRFCRKCGHGNLDEAKFCEACGEPFLTRGSAGPSDAGSGADPASLRRVKPWMLLGCVLVAVALVAAAYFAYVVWLKPA